MPSSATRDALTALFYIFCGCGLLLNMLVVLAFFVDLKLRQFSHNIYILNLALTDLLFDINLIVYAAAISQRDFTPGHTSAACSATGYIAMYLPACSIFFLAAMAISAARGILRPFEADLPSTDKKIRWSIVLIYLYAGVLVAFAFFDDGRPRLYTNELICVVDFREEYGWGIATLVHICIIFIIMVVAYALIITNICKHGKRWVEMAKQEHLEASVSDRRERARNTNLAVAKRLIVVGSVYLVMWVPFGISLLWDLYDREQEDRDYEFDSIAVLFVCLGTAANPIVYGVTNSDIWGAYRSLFVQIGILDPPRDDFPGAHAMAPNHRTAEPSVGPLTVAETLLAVAGADDHAVLATSRASTSEQPATPVNLPPAPPTAADGHGSEAPPAARSSLSVQEKTGTGTSSVLEYLEVGKGDTGNSQALSQGLAEHMPKPSSTAVEASSAPAPAPAPASAPAHQQPAQHNKTNSLAVPPTSTPTTAAIPVRDARGRDSMTFSPMSTCSTQSFVGFVASPDGTVPPPEPTKSRFAIRRGSKE